MGKVDTLKDNTVAIVREQNIEDMVDEVFALLKPKLGQSQTCIVKPNLCALKKASTGATTHPELVEALVNRIRDHCSNVLIVESNSSALEAEAKFKFCGYHEVAKQTGAKLVNLTKEDRIPVRLEHAGMVIDLPEILFDCNYILSVPTLKTHCLTVFTANIKNAYGLIPFPHKTAFHSKVNEVIADLHLVIQTKPTLCVVDGIVGMEGNGPIKGTPVHFRTVIAGEDPLIVDAACCYAMGINPNKVKHLRLCAKYEGRRVPEINQIKAIGEELESVRKNFVSAPTRPPFHTWLRESVMGLGPASYILDRTLYPIIRYYREKTIKAR